MKLTHKLLKTNSVLVIYIRYSSWMNQLSQDYEKNLIQITITPRIIKKPKIIFINNTSKQFSSS